MCINILSREPLAGRALIRCIFILMVQIGTLNATNAQNDSFRNSAKDQLTTGTIALYQQVAGLHSVVYRGLEYQFEHINNGHPFFGNTGVASGDVVLDDIRYPDVQLLYDIVKDELVIRSLNKINFITLPGKKIGSFTIAGATFFNLPADSLAGTEMAPGFYQRLLDGRIKVWVKRQKSIEESSDLQLKLKKTAIEKDVWFVQKEGRFFVADGERTVLNLLKDNKKEIRSFLKNHRISFRREMDQAMIRTISYYVEIGGR